MEEISNKQMRYEVVDKSVNTVQIIDKADNTVQKGILLEVITNVILQHFESGTRMILTAVRYIPDNTYLYTDKIDPVEILIIGDEVIMEDGVIAQVLVKKRQ